MLRRIIGAMFSVKLSTEPSTEPSAESSTWFNASPTVGAVVSPIH